MSQFRLPLGGLAGLICLATSVFTSAEANAQVPLTRADVEALQNRVEFLPDEGTTRPALLSDWLSLGDAIRTAAASRVDLRFNDGSLARVGEQATFWFVPDTRNFRLSNGTALFLIPPGRGPSVIETPSAVTGIQGTALIVRHVPESTNSSWTPQSPAREATGNSTGRTVVMVLTNNPAGPVEVSLPDGRKADLTAGQMAVIDNGDLFILEFDLRLFYETSPLVDDLHLDDPNYSDPESPTDPVRQETLEGLSQQQDFVGEYLLNPDYFDPAIAASEAQSLFITADSNSNGRNSQGNPVNDAPNPRNAEYGDERNDGIPGNNPENSGPPGLDGSGPPGLDGSGPPGLDGSGPPGLDGSGPPGLDGSGPPGLDGSGPPGLDGSGPPGLGGSGPPGLDGSGPPGLNGSGPPGLNGSGPPGLDGSGPPGLGNSNRPDGLTVPPGLLNPSPVTPDDAPGNSGNAPGNSGDAPGNSGDAPGNSGNAPGNSGDAPGNSGNAPGNSGNGQE